MSLEELISFQEKQLQLLRRERATAMEALTLAGALGSFSPSLSRHVDNMPILHELSTRMQSMLEMRSLAVYLMDDDSLDMTITLCEPAEHEAELDAFVAELIEDGSFALTLNGAGPHFFRLPDGSGDCLLHAMRSGRRVHGMFVALLNQKRDTILDTTLGLISLVMQSAAHALEAFEANKAVVFDAQRLEARVRQRTQDLSEANAQLSLILDSIQTGVMIINAESMVITDANPAALTMLKTTREELLGRRCFGSICHEPDENCPFHSRMAERLNAERTIQTFTGEMVPVVENVQEIAMHGVRYFLKSFMDISEQKKLSQLKEDVERITRHDLKSPLNGIINLPDVIASLGPLNEKQSEMLGYIKAAGYTMLRQINMSLDLYKMETGTYTYAPERRNILTIMNDAIHSLEPKFDTRGVSVSISVDGVPADEDMRVLLECDEQLMLSLFSNLLTNAVEASPKGYHVSVAVLEFSRETVVEIHNYGIIPLQVRERFFDKYATYGKQGGTGLGTYSARLMAETMGGRISFQTAEETGTTLSVTFPVARS